MKKLLVVAFMIVGTATFAQVNGTTPQGNKMPDNAKLIEMRSQKMKTDFGLNDQQTAQISALFTKQQQNREVVIAEVAALRANGQQLTDEQKRGIKSKMDALQLEMDSQIKNIFTPEQYAAWQNKIGVMKAQQENKATLPAKGS